jgi:hypothetical protein
MLTTIIRPTTTTFAWCAAESETADLFSFAALWQAYLTCRRRKAGTAQAQRYALRLLDNIENTAQALQDRSYKPARSLCFVARRPKAREIHAAHFADRVVHHLLVPQLEALYEPIFIHDVYSNRKNKGTHAAVRRLQSFMRRLDGSGQNSWYLQLDIRNFFVSINRRILFTLIQTTVHKKHPGNVEQQAQLLWLTRLLLTGNPAKNAVKQGNLADFSRVPAYKQLANAAPEYGLPIGNLSSQFFANVYLNELDQFVKHQLKCKFYLRYVDDFILLHHDPAQLLIWRQAIVEFLDEHLKLTLKDLAAPQLITQGADFLGYIVRPRYCLVRRRVVGNLYEKLIALEKHLCPAPNYLRLPPLIRQQLQATLASYLGHFQHAHSERLLQRLERRFPWLAQLFHRQAFLLTPRWQAQGASSFRSQWSYFVRQWPGHLILIQLGGRCYAFNQDALTLVKHRGCRLDTSPRTGFDASVSVSFPSLYQQWLPRLRTQHIAYCLVLEDGYLKNGLKQRLLYALFYPPLAINQHEDFVCQ